jgi:hypothetical protein
VSGRESNGREAGLESRLREMQLRVEESRGNTEGKGNGRGGVFRVLT